MPSTAAETVCASAELTLCRYMYFRFRLALYCASSTTSDKASVPGKLKEPKLSVTCSAARSACSGVVTAAPGDKIAPAPQPSSSESVVLVTAMAASPVLAVVKLNVPVIAS